MLKYYLLLIVLVLCGGCGDFAADPFPEQTSFSFSFEKDFEEWTPGGTDLDSPPVAWSIQRAQEMSKDGNTALKLYLSNLNDGGKIWIERQFLVQPNTLYRVSVKYSFASGDYGMVNHWTLITGLTQKPAKTRDDLTYQGNTGNGSDTPGYKWLEKSYDFTVQSGLEGKLYLTIGVWGTWETPHTYYIDGVLVSFNEKK